MRFVAKVDAAILAPKRLDPDYYRPEHIRDERILRAMGAAELRETGHFFAGPFGSELPSSLYLEKGVPLFRVGNIGQLTVIRDGMAHLDEAIHRNLKKSEVVPGDLLIVKASVGEKICVLPDSIPRANITQHIIGIHPNGQHDIEFIAAFLFSNYGRRQLQRRSLGSIIQYLGITDSKDVLFPRIDIRAQKYIGSILKTGAKLRLSAADMEVRFERDITTCCPEIMDEYRQEGRCSMANSEELGRTLNPGAFNPERLRIRRLLVASGGRLISAVAHIDAGVSAKYSNQDAYLGLEGISTSDGSLRFSSIGQEEVFGAVRVLRSGPVISKLRPYLNKVSYVPKEYNGAFGSTELLCVVPADSVSGWFLYGVLKLQCSVRQLQPLAVGSTHPRFTRDDLRELMIPWTEDHARLGRMLELAQRNRQLAASMTTAATMLIEALIEGKVTEADLIEAQQALARGDHGPDRALLGRLKRDGMDAPNSPPLFPDLDALDEILRQAEAENPNPA